jgi:hypothetical protein
MSEVEYVHGVQGVIDLDDIMRVCRRYGGDIRLREDEEEQLKETKSILANYLGLEKPTSLINFSGFMGVVRPR